MNCTVLHAEEIIADVNIAGEVFKDMVVDTKTFKVSEPLQVGKCKSKDLKVFGTPTFNGQKVVIETLNQECFENKEISLSYRNTFTPVKSNSFFLSFNLNKELTPKAYDSAYFGTGLFIHDYFIYSSFVYNRSEISRKFERLYSYLQRDIDPLLSVIKIGEIYPSIASSLIPFSERRLGLTFQRKWILDPGQCPYLSLSRQIILNTKSTVEIIQNNSVVLRIELPAGVYNLKDLPVYSLIGTYTIRITDAFNRVTEQTETYIVSSELLKKGFLDYSVTLLLEKPELTGFLQYGVSDSLTAGIHFSRTEQSFSFDYLSFLGQTSLELSTERDLRLVHTYQKDRLNLAGEFLRKDSKNSIIALASYTIENRGTFGLRLERNNRTRLGLNWSKNFSNMNVSLSINSDSEFNVNTSHHTKVLNKHITLGASYLHTKDNKRFYAYLTMPLENTAKTFGVDIRTLHDRQNTAGESEIKARYVFDYALKNRLDRNKNTSVLSMAGAFGCVHQNSEFKCGAGNFVGEADGFVIASGDTVVDGKEREGLNTLSTYRDVIVKNTGEFVEADVKVAARHGQGVLVPEPVLVIGKVVTGEKLKSIYINNEEVFITEEGDFSCIAYSDEIKVTANGRSQKIKLKPEQGVATVEIVF